MITREFAMQYALSLPRPTKSKTHLDILEMLGLENKKDRGIAYQYKPWSDSQLEELKVDPVVKKIYQFLRTEYETKEQTTLHQTN